MAWDDQSDFNPVFELEREGKAVLLVARINNAVFPALCIGIILMAWVGRDADDVLTSSIMLFSLLLMPGFLWLGGVIMRSLAARLTEAHKARMPMLVGQIAVWMNRETTWSGLWLGAQPAWTNSKYVRSLFRSYHAACRALKTSIELNSIATASTIGVVIVLLSILGPMAYQGLVLHERVSNNARPEFIMVMGLAYLIVVWPLSLLGSASTLAMISVMKDSVEEIERLRADSIVDQQ